MDVLVDLQACQSESRYRGIGRYSLALTDGLLRIGAPHQFQLLLNAQFPHSAVSLRDRFAHRLPREQMHVFDGLRHVAEIDATNQWRCRAAERIREACLARIDPDVVLLSSLFEGFVDDATTSIST